MLEIRKWTQRAWVGALLVLGLLPTPAGAQSVLNVDTGSCDPAPSADCTECIYCCESTSNCLSTVGYMSTCLPVGGLDGMGLCLSGHNYCGDTPTVAQAVACHTSPDHMRPVPWGNGDCDGDGIPNQREIDLGTDPCVPPAPPSVLYGTTCAPLNTGCNPSDMPGATCTSGIGVTGTCQVSADANGTVCMPDAILLCCSSDPDCPDGRCVSAPTAGAHVCAPALCADVPGIDPVDCITSPTGQAVPAPQGDCDRDDIPNRSDSTPCGGTGDAGVATTVDGGAEDGGNATYDGGASSDAGTQAGDASTSMDGGGDTVQPTFTGGGGCACRAAPGHGPGNVAWLGLVGLALLVRRRR